MTMTFEDYIRSRLAEHATVTMKPGRSSDNVEASIMTYDEKIYGTWFWKVDGNSVELIQFVGKE